MVKVENEYQRLVALNEAARAVGSYAALARRLGMTRGALHQWKRRQVPAARVLQVESATGVPRSALRPDLYPPATL
jgi:DNA-binding transcriptional regulator YdaS (Cro superfamily)